MPNTTRFKDHLQLGLGGASAGTMYVLADALYGIEYALTKSLGVSADLHTYVGLPAGIGVGGG